MRLALLVLASGGLVCAHVGSPDIFLEGNAGPYPLFVTIRPPAVIPGVAEVEIRVRSKDISQVRIVPTPVSGAGARFAPTPDIAQRSSAVTDEELVALKTPKENETYVRYLLQKQKVLDLLLQ